jgi:molybdate transport system substrate-binding protein
MARILKGGLIAALLSTAAGAAPADTIRVAVASNFRHAIDALAPRFEQATGHAVTRIFGSTGKHFAQISNGAPFDVFLAADELRPRMLEEDGSAVAGTRFVYALGMLVLWSPREGYVDPDGKRLERGGYRFLSIANPTLAPYGRAARQVLEALDLWESLQPRLVRGENIGQAHQFVVSGNADLGFVAHAQVALPGMPATGSRWDVPQSYYDPIEQHAVLLRDTPATRAFAEYLRGDEARAIIRSHGYTTP